jgi:hypothetical protein
MSQTSGPPDESTPSPEEPAPPIFEATTTVAAQAPGLIAAQIPVRVVAQSPGAVVSAAGAAAASAIAASSVLGTNAISAAGPGVRFVSIQPAQLAGIDNTLWTAGIDTSVISTVQRPRKTIVVSQDPPAGTEVPFGTTVSLTLASIDAIPLKVLKDPGGLSFNTVGDLQTALAANPALMTSVTNAASFQALSPTDQTAFTTFATTHGGADPTAAFGAAKIVASL